jgi:hypothetical protein
MAEQKLSYQEYLASVPPERREAVDKVWQVVRQNMPPGYEESIDKFLTFKAGEEWYVALASQKRYISLYLLPIYVYPELKAKLDATGKKLKGGKSCIYFIRPEDLPLESIAEIVAATPAQAWRDKVTQVRRESKNKRRRAP